MRGFFEIGIERGKCVSNVGTLWRTASQLGAAGIFTVGKRYPKQASDTLKTYRHIPQREYLDMHALRDAMPYDCQLVGIEMGGTPLVDFKHPERAVYLLGAEDHGLTALALGMCHRVVSLPSVRTASYNVAVAGALVMFDRYQKEQARCAS